MANKAYHILSNKVEKSEIIVLSYVCTDFYP